MIVGKDYKKRNIFKYVFGVILSILFYILMRLVLWKIQIENIYLLEICKALTDAGAIFIMTLLCNVVVIAVSSDRDFDFRGRTHVIEVISIIEFVCYVLLKENQTRLWLDIVLFCILFFFMLVRDNDYLNTQKIIAVRQSAYGAYEKYSREYEKFIRNVDSFNEMEDELLQARVENVNDDKEIRKAEKDKREISISGKWNPDRHVFPDDRGLGYTGILGLFVGKDAVFTYMMKVGNYINKLEKDYQKYERENRKIVALNENAESAKRYIEGTNDEKKLEAYFEKEGYERINRTEKVRNSYNKFNRKWYDKKKKKY